MGRSAVVVGGLIAAPRCWRPAHPRRPRRHRRAAASTAPSRRRQRRRRPARRRGRDQRHSASRCRPTPDPRKPSIVRARSALAGQGWRAMDALESIYASGPGLQQPERAARPRGQGLAGHPGPGREVGGVSRRAVLDVQPQARACSGPTATRSRPTTTSRRSSTRPTRSTPGTSPGTTTGSSRTSARRPAGKVPTDRGRHHGRRGQVPGRVHDGEAGRRTCPRCSSGRRRSTRSRWPSTAPASTTSTRRRP